MTGEIPDAYLVPGQFTVLVVSVATGDVLRRVAPTLKEARKEARMWAFKAEDRRKVMLYNKKGKQLSFD